MPSQEQGRNLHLLLGLGGLAIALLLGAVLRLALLHSFRSNLEIREEDRWELFCMRLPPLSGRRCRVFRLDSDAQHIEALAERARAPARLTLQEEMVLGALAVSFLTGACFCFSSVCNC